MNKNLTVFLIVVTVSLATLFFLSSREKELPEGIIMNTEKPQSSEKIEVKLQTNLGDITLELYPKKAPKTVDNFVTLARDGFYDGTKFHRVIKDFMIQGGDPLSKDDSQRSYWGTGGPGYKFEDEPNDLLLEKGVLAMANSGPDTNGSQFFIITADATPWLQGKHTGFGKVISGMDVVDKIENQATGSSDQPLEDIVVERVEVSS